MFSFCNVYYFRFFFSFGQIFSLLEGGDVRSLIYFCSNYSNKFQAYIDLIEHERVVNCHKLIYRYNFSVKCGIGMKLIEISLVFYFCTAIEQIKNAIVIPSSVASNTIDNCVHFNHTIWKRKYTKLIIPTQTRAVN